jgi:integrating conjugative element protein (TIGR03758 family)
MDSAAAQRFRAGAGIDPGPLHEAAGLGVALAVLLWAAWAVHGLYRQWREDATDLLGLVLGTVRTTVVVVMILYFLNP